jgi:hypothetical protein
MTLFFDSHLLRIPSHSSLYLRMIFSQSRVPPRIKSGAGFFGIMLFEIMR